MAKFAALSSKDLRTPKREEGRLARRVPFVVFVEVDDGSWCELDADSESHGETLAQNWVDKLSARGCSVWRVREGSGKLAKRPTFTYYAGASNGEA